MRRAGRLKGKTRSDAALAAQVAAAHRASEAETLSAARSATHGGKSGCAGWRRARVGTARSNRSRPGSSGHTPQRLRAAWPVVGAGKQRGVEGRGGGRHGGWDPDVLRRGGRRRRFTLSRERSDTRSPSWRGGEEWEGGDWDPTPREHVGRTWAGPVFADARSAWRCAMVAPN